MNTKTTAIILGAALLLGAAALLMNRPASSTSRADAPPALLLPDLKDHINDVARLDIKRPGDSLSITRTGDTWGLSTKHNYPVQIEHVKALVLGLSELRPLEPKTSNPDLYSKIGVQNPPDTAPPPTPPPANPDDQPPAQPTLVILSDAQGKPLASVILGTQRWGTPPTIFVRSANDKQSWLAQGKVDVPADAMQWIDRQALNIPRDRVRSVSIVHPDGAEIDASRTSPTDPAFFVKNIPAGRELSAPTAAESLATSLQSLSIDDVAPIDTLPFEAPTVMVLRTFDGLVVTARTTAHDAKAWVNFTFSFDDQITPAPPTPEAQPTPPAGQKSPDDVKKEVADLTARLSPWAFAIPEYKAKSLTSHLEDLLKPLPAPPVESEPIGPSPSPTGDSPDHGG